MFLKFWELGILPRDDTGIFIVDVTLLIPLGGDKRVFDGGASFWENIGHH